LRWGFSAIFFDKQGSIWFLAKDVLMLLQDNKNPDVSNATKDLDNDELTRFKIVSGGQSREMLFVSESGLYSLIMRSRKPIAKPFQKWVTKEVLPSIRKTGSYSLQKEEHELKKVDLNEIQETLKIGSEILETLQTKNVFEKIQLDNFLKSQKGISVLEILKINFENFLFLPTELGKFIGISAIEMNQNLREKGLQIKSENGWQLTEKGQKFGVDVSENFPQIKWKIEVLFL
jgi:prophage antirepressor-like protein/predicted transcriptional regulator